MISAQPVDTSTLSHLEETSLRTTISDHRYGEDYIKIEESTQPLCTTVRNDEETVVIGRVDRGGTAYESGLLEEGDEILEVNGIEIRDKSVNTVCAILQTMNRELTILIISASELEMSFQKVECPTCYKPEDLNWYQANREGFSWTYLSQIFQHLRECLRISALETMSKPLRKSSMLLCGKGTRYNPENILAHKEISLYTRANSEKPIVLIGLPNIRWHKFWRRPRKMWKD
ncbi:hypothetical protein WA026_016588 [Henosepilachna vigintioctopunctata]|uniref:PDZ domain-containing protein n=1 Tax=Henosepilachna vigintioctopunctata TaxID=420089 RepID=A0AAW1V7X9_9CUCU